MGSQMLSLNRSARFQTLPSSGRRGVAWYVVLVAGLQIFCVSCSNRQTAEPSSKIPSQSATSKYETLSLRGQVVWMAEALAQNHGVTSLPEAAQRVIALQAEDGTLYPILEDVRGGSFRKDERLRGVPLELLVRRHDGSPMVQVIQVFAIDDDGKYELDYWCDICAIAMYELKPCDCCQGSIELRRRRVPTSQLTELK